MPVDVEQQVSVIGLGYIGLPTAALIARSGAKVLEPGRNVYVNLSAVF